MKRHGARVHLLLGLGATLGLALATADLLDLGDRRAAPDASGAVARVNDTPIRAADYQRALAAFADDRRAPLEDADRQHVLDRMIDEELLVQRGLELDFPRRDRRVRADIVSAMIAAVTSEAATSEPSAAEVAAFYEENRDYFARPGRLRARQVLVRASAGRSDAEARERALQAARRLQGGADFATVRAELGDAEIVPLPDTLLPIAKLRDYLGPTAARALLHLAPGQISDPIRAAGGYHVLELLERSADDQPPLAEVEEQVRVELRRRAGDAALRTYLDDLRRSADVEVREAAP
jgi:parvulin-like peptidyl-prolyl isomerase